MKSIIYFVLLGCVVSTPVDEFSGMLNGGDITSTLRRLVPGYSPMKINIQKSLELSDLVDKNNSLFIKFQDFIDKGVTAKGLTFNIYDDDMREAAITLFRLMKDLDDGIFQAVKEWVHFNVNSDLGTYTMMLLIVYSNRLNPEEIVPPFINKPNYFINSETLFKAAQLKLHEGKIDLEEAEVKQFFKKDDVIYINTNYSGWNDILGKCNDNLNYFREDVELNSYYYGLHLLHPFWMSNIELYEVSPRSAEHYYFAHQQLVARYMLEHEHVSETARQCKKSSEQNAYNPQLIYDNGLPFPIRNVVEEEWNEGRAYMKTVDIAIRECINRGLIIMKNGTTVNITEADHISLLTKLIRANVDSTKSAKIIRNLYGYAGQYYDMKTYNPAPSILHHPQTSLRDPLYWKLVNDLLQYFAEYKQTLKPMNLTDIEYENFVILDSNVKEISTYFSNHDIDLTKSLIGNEYLKSPLIIAARQRRINHEPFDFEFKIESKVDKNAILSLFLGPDCEGQECFELFSKFYELDAYNVNLKEGNNYLKWDPIDSPRYSPEFTFYKNTKQASKYNIFKFPQRLIVPRGTENGLKLKLFVMIVPVEGDPSRYSTIYDYVYKEVSNQPMGFPFNRPSTGYSVNAPNYKFYDIVVYHNKKHTKANSYFSPHLY